MQAPVYRLAGRSQGISNSVGRAISVRYRDRGSASHGCSSGCRRAVHRARVYSRSRQNHHAVSVAATRFAPTRLCPGDVTTRSLRPEQKRSPDILDEWIIESAVVDGIARCGTLARQARTRWRRPPVLALHAADDHCPQPPSDRCFWGIAPRWAACGDVKSSGAPSARSTLNCGGSRANHNEDIWGNRHGYQFRSGPTPGE